MVAAVQKFTIEYEGNWLPVLYIIEKRDGNTITYCAVGDKSQQLFIDADKVTGVEATPD